MNANQISYPDWLVGFELHAFRISGRATTLGFRKTEEWNASLVVQCLWRIRDARTGHLLVTSCDGNCSSVKYPPIDRQNVTLGNLNSKTVTKMTLDNASHDLILHFDDGLDFQIFPTHSRCEMWNIAVGDNRYIGLVDRLVVIEPQV